MLKTKNLKIISAYFFLFIMAIMLLAVINMQIDNLPSKNINTSNTQSGGAQSGNSINEENFSSPVSDPDTSQKISENISDSTLVSRNYSLYKELENGEIYSNGTHYRASVTTKPIRITDENNSLVYYSIKKLNQTNYLLQSVHGKWLLSKDRGVVLLYKNESLVYEQEQWGLVFSGSLQTVQSSSINLVEKNKENLTITVSKEYTQGQLNISYNWIKGYLKINVELLTYTSGNFRVGLQIDGLNQFTTQDLFHLNKTNFAINFDDMKSHIDLSQSSFSNGVLTLVSNNFALSIGQQIALDPSSYETNDEDDFYLRKFPDGSYTSEKTVDLMNVGNYTINNVEYRSFMRFNLGFIGYKSKILSSNLSLTIGFIFSVTSLRNISLLGYDYGITGASESNVIANSSIFNNDYLQNGTYYNITKKLSTATVGTSELFNITDFSQEFINDRTQDYLSWQIRGFSGEEVISFADSQHSTYQAPSLSIEWVTDTLPPAISFNNSENSNKKYLQIEVYDQPTSSASGLNLSTLAYSLDGQAWDIVTPISISNDFPTVFNITNPFTDNQEHTLAFRISDLNGNWGYSNSSFGKQYYPKCTGDYCFRNETEQIGWGEDWTESIIPYVIEGALDFTKTLETGLFGNSAKIEISDNSGANLIDWDNAGNNLLNLPSISSVSFFMKANKTVEISSVTVSDYLFTNYLVDNTNFFVTTSWQKFTISFSDMTIFGTPDHSAFDRIRWAILTYNYSIWIDGLHFENEDGDSCTESLDCHGISNTWYYSGGPSWGIPELVIDSHRGYEGIKYTIENTSASFTPRFDLLTTQIDINSYDTFSFSAKANESIILSYIALYDLDSNLLIYNPDITVTTSYTNFNISLSSFTGGLNSSIFKTILFRTSSNSFNITFDGLNFYQSNQSIWYDTQSPEVILSHDEDCLNAFDYVSYGCSTSASQTTLYYSNDQSMNSSLTLSLTSYDATSGLKNVTGGLYWNDGTNISISATTNYTFDITYYIEQDENFTGQLQTGLLNLTVWDYAENNATVSLAVEIDNSAPTSYSISALFTEVYSYCAPVNVTNMTDQLNAGMFKYYLRSGNYQTNFTSAGIVNFCVLTHGIQEITSVAYDNVGNEITSTTSVYIQVVLENNELQLVYGDNLDKDYFIEVSKFITSNQDLIFLLLINVFVIGLVVLIYRKI
jgi:hypothetical protein